MRTLFDRFVQLAICKYQYEKSTKERITKTTIPKLNGESKNAFYWDVQLQKTKSTRKTNVA